MRAAALWREVCADAQWKQYGTEVTFRVDECWPNGPHVMMCVSAPDSDGSGNPFADTYGWSPGGWYGREPAELYMLAMWLRYVEHEALEVFTVAGQQPYHTHRPRSRAMVMEGTYEGRFKPSGVTVPVALAGLLGEHQARAILLEWSITAQNDLKEER